MENDGYQIAVVEQGDESRSLATPLVSDEDRFAAKPGDIVKMIFEYKEGKKRKGDGAKIGSEHMWVEVTEHGDGCLVGRLDCSPQFTDLLKADDRIQFHPKHIIAFWNEN